MKKVGILGFQGSVLAHTSMLEACGAGVTEVRTAQALSQIDALVIPGGESTTIGKLLVRLEMMEPLRNLISKGLPVYGTCAGMILLAKEILHYPDQDRIGVMDISVDRNAYGRQIESFEADLAIPELGPETFHSIFIRAPRVKSAAQNVKILAQFEDEPVLVRQDNILAGNFHPELGKDKRVHEYFLDFI